MRIFHNRPFLNDRDEEAIIKVFDSCHIAQGKRVEKFEDVVVRFLGTKGYACALSNGTSALFLSLYSLGVKKNDEVIVPTYVCSALLNAIYFVGARPIVIDINNKDFNLSFSHAERSFSKNTKAIIIPHIFGVPADLNQFKSLGLPIIEDCAQSFGATYKSAKTGTSGDIATFSFYATKLLTTGNGGMVYSKNKKLIEKIRDFRQFDCRKKYYPRFNFQMSDIQAALGLSQLKRITFMLSRREEIAKKYISVLNKKGIRFQKSTEKSKRVYYRFVIIDKNVNLIKKALKQKGIETIVPIEPWELLHRYLHKDRKQFPNAEHIAKTTLSLPVYPALSDKQVDYIIKVLKRI